MMERSGTTARCVMIGSYWRHLDNIVTPSGAAACQAGCRQEGRGHGLIRRAMPALLWPQGDKDVSDEGMLDYMLPNVKGDRILRYVSAQLVLGSAG